MAAIFTGKIISYNTLLLTYCYYVYYILWHVICLVINLLLLTKNGYIMKITIKLTLISVVLSLSVLANAATITNVYSVTDAVSTHGLWTNQLHFNGDNTFHYQPDTFLTQYDDNTAILKGTASDSGVTWNINVLFSDYRNFADGSPIKNGGGGDLNTWEYYDTVSGIISTNYGAGNSYNVTRFGPSMQLGYGANDKNGDFGSSSWLSISGSANTLANRWDLNMNLSAVSIPEPSILFLLSLGLMGIGVVRRR